MNREEKLLSLLQPKEYKSKLKLFCVDCKFEVKTFGSLNNNSYIAPKIIKIQEL